MRVSLFLFRLSVLFPNNTTQLLCCRKLENAGDRNKKIKSFLNLRKLNFLKDMRDYLILARVYGVYVCVGMATLYLVLKNLY